MDVYLVRQHNLQQLATRHGGVVALAHALERDPSLISRYLAYPSLKGTRLGEKMTRHIEQTLILPTGWLSTHHTDNLPDHPLLTAACSYLSTSPDPRVADILTALLTALTPPRP